MQAACNPLCRAQAACNPYVSQVRHAEGSPSPKSNPNPNPNPTLARCATPSGSTSASALPSRPSSACHTSFRTGGDNERTMSRPSSSCYSSRVLPPSRGSASLASLAPRRPVTASLTKAELLREAELLKVQ
jgi:hypothetical protein